MNVYYCYLYFKNSQTTLRMKNVMGQKKFWKNEKICKVEKWFLKILKKIQVQKYHKKKDPKPILLQ